ncbi:hypothetical protein [Parasitella parasitica]|uniref:Uncharacterized protein n=1 Tax=Parasitella parasitica TaxID=35722 RepID=A0A0B7NRF8_9FUNG|nr:hypothetical protein [Parasitella parasitica]
MQVAVVLCRFSSRYFGYRIIQATLGFSQGPVQHLISWPLSDEEFAKVKKKFEYPDNADQTIRKLPNAIGVVDGKLIMEGVIFDKFMLVKVEDATTPEFSVEVRFYQCSLIQEHTLKIMIIFWVIPR